MLSATPSIFWHELQDRIKLKSITIHSLKDLTREITVFIIGAIFIVPISMVLPKKKNCVAFIGRDNGQFIDNVKYLYLYVQDNIESGLEAYFITENNLIFDELNNNRLNAVFHPTFKSILKMLRTNITIIDAPTWVGKFKYFILFGSKKVQLWHGIPLKKIQLECKDMKFKKTSKFKRALNPIYSKIALHEPKYNLLISTSNYFTEHAFKIAFKANDIYEAEFPRNDILIKNRNLNNNILIWTDVNVIENVKKLKQEGKKLILYAPTFRETGNDLFEKKSSIFNKWSKYGIKNNIQFIIKIHPLIKIDQTIYKKKNVINYANNKDIYPLLTLIDLLITDYSSIYFDFLLVDKPIIFFPYDYDKYITSDKELRFNYDLFTPGPKCYSETELENKIDEILNKNIDEYGAERKRIRDICFSNKDGNGAEKIWNYIFTKFITN